MIRPGKWHGKPLIDVMVQKLILEFSNKIQVPTKAIELKTTVCSTATTSWAYTSVLTDMADRLRPKGIFEFLGEF